VGWAELHRLKWRTFAGALAAVTLLLLADAVVPVPPAGWVRAALRGGAALAGIWAFNEYVFGRIRRVQQTAWRQERLRLRALHEIGTSLASLPAVAPDLSEGLEVVRRVTGSAVVAWFEPGPGDGPLCCGAVVGAPAELAARAAAELPGQAWAEGRALFVEDVEQAGGSAQPLLRAAGLRGAAALCGGVSGRSTGVLLLGWRVPHAPGSGERAFLAQVADLVAAAAEGVRRYRETERLAALQERQRLAREMHDGLAQALTYLKLKAESALAQAGMAGGPGVLVSALEAIRRGAMEALGDVRQAILDLKAPAGGDEGDFTDHLARYLQSWSRLSDIQAELQLPTGRVDLPEETGLHVLRVVQEALANVRKHALASRVWVRLAREDGEVTVRVADDGRGFDPAQAQRPGHFGLHILRERAAAVGGTVTVRSRPGAGCEVVLRLPEPGRAPAALAAAAGGRG
jgi:two-component system nitrate/nitrite sensor histidine kinase NarX